MDLVRRPSLHRIYIPIKKEQAVLGLLRQPSSDKKQKPENPYLFFKKKKQIIHLEYKFFEF